MTLEWYYCNTHTHTPMTLARAQLEYVFYRQFDGPHFCSLAIITTQHRTIFSCTSDSIFTPAESFRELWLNHTQFPNAHKYKHTLWKCFPFYLRSRKADVVVVMMGVISRREWGWRTRMRCTLNTTRERNWRPKTTLVWRRMGSNLSNGSKQTVQCGADPVAV